MDAVRLHQAGITYAVATLGTATTPEHFRRIFRLVREVVFAFDGDRAGRAAAWRALQQALPEAREGREIRFLFLPEGHDPDTLVGEEGREAFEQRLETALPLSEYLVRELEGAGRPVARRRPRTVRRARATAAREGARGRLPGARSSSGWRGRRDLRRERLEELWTAGHGPPPAALHGTLHRQRGARASAVAARGDAGRGSLVRQAIVRLVRFPAIAAEVSAAERAGLE